MAGRRLAGSLDFLPFSHKLFNVMVDAIVREWLRQVLVDLLLCGTLLLRQRWMMLKKSMDTLIELFE